MTSRRGDRKSMLAQNTRPTNVMTSKLTVAPPVRKMGKPKTPEEERAAAARREAIMKAFSQTSAPKAAPRLSDVSTSSSTRSTSAIDRMLTEMDAGPSRKRDTTSAPWAGTECVDSRLYSGSLLLTESHTVRTSEIPIGFLETWRRKSLAS